MSRVQLALRVPDLEASIAFYTKLFGVEPWEVHVVKADSATYGTDPGLTAAACCVDDTPAECCG